MFGHKALPGVKLAAQFASTQGSMERPRKRWRLLVPQRMEEKDEAREGRRPHQLEHVLEKNKELENKVKSTALTNATMAAELESSQETVRKLWLGVKLLDDENNLHCSEKKSLRREVDCLAQRNERLHDMHCDALQQLYSLQREVARKQDRERHIRVQFLMSRESGGA